MKLGIGIVCCLLGGAVAFAQSQEVHPRLFATAKEFDVLKGRCKSDPFCTMGLKKVVAESQKLLKEKPCERVMEGRRLLTISRRVLERVSHLSLAYRLTGDKVYANRAIEEMRAVAAFKDWNPSHFLDVAEMTLAVAIGYDWCYDAMSEADRQLILDTLVTHSMKPAQKGGWWVNANNNWGQVCHAGILSGAYCLKDTRPEFAKEFTPKAVKGLPRAMAAFAPGGNYPEGPGYWHYGTEFNLLAIELLERSEGSDFGLTKLPGFEATGDYMNLVTGPSRMTFNYADSGSGRGSGCASWWFAKRYNRPDIVSYFELDSFKRYCDGTKGGNRLFAFCVLWYSPMRANTPVKSPLLWSPGGENAIITQRTSWDDEKATFVGFKAGRENTNHAQMDAGSFVLDRYGIRWAYELGMEDYNRIESRKMNLWSSKIDSDRWKILRLGSQGHNTLILNGALHDPTGEAKILSAVAGKNGASTAKLDLSSFFPVAKEVTRESILSADGTYEIRDVIKAPAGTKVRWQMFTKGQPGENRTGALVLSDRGKVLNVTALHNPQTKWQSTEEKELRQEWDSPNKDIRVIWFEETIPASGELKYAVRFH